MGAWEVEGMTPEDMILVSEDDCFKYYEADGELGRIPCRLRYTVCKINSKTKLAEYLSKQRIRWSHKKVEDE